MAYILPGVLFSSVAGVFVDRWDRRMTIIIVNILQMLTIPLLLLVRSPELIWIVYIVAFLESTLSQFFGPAASALLPTLVGEENLTAANSLNSLNDNLARIFWLRARWAASGLVARGIKKGAALKATPHRRFYPQPFQTIVSVARQAAHAELAPRVC
jgi:MFS family permease